MKKNSNGRTNRLDFATYVVIIVVIIWGCDTNVRVADDNDDSKKRLLYIIIHSASLLQYQLHSLFSTSSVSRCLSSFLN